MYTFDDWLNDGIFEKSKFPNTYMGIDFLPLSPNELVSQGKMNQEDATQINDKQAEAFKRAVRMNVHAYETAIKLSLAKAIDPKEYLEFHLAKLEKRVQDNLDAYNESNTATECGFITGGTYRRICQEWDKFMEGDRYDIFSLSRSDDDLNFRMHLLRNQIGAIKELLHLIIPGMPNPYRINGLFGIREQVQVVKKEIPARVFVAWTMAKEDQGERFDTIESLQRALDENGATTTLLSVRSNRSEHSDKREMKKYLYKKINKGQSGFDILRTMVDGQEVVKHIEQNWNLPPK